MKKLKPHPIKSVSNKKEAKKAPLAFQEIFVKDIEETQEKALKRHPSLKTKATQRPKSKQKESMDKEHSSHLNKLSSQLKKDSKKPDQNPNPRPADNKALSKKPHSPSKNISLVAKKEPKQSVDEKNPNHLNKPSSQLKKDSKKPDQNPHPRPADNKALSKKNHSPSKNTPLVAKKGKNPVGDPEALQVLEARKLQMMSRSSSEGASSPLQMHIVRSESLRIAQERIDGLKEELDELRKINQSLSSASSILQDKNDKMKSHLEEMDGAFAEEKNTFKNEKEIFTAALEDATQQINHLQEENKKLEERLSNEFQGIRERESSLESRIEILKMENTALQREKDKKIIELKKNLRKNLDILQAQQKKNRILHEENIRLRDSSRRAVSTLRALIFHLEGLKVGHNNEATTPPEKKSA